MKLNLLLAESALELVPDQIKNHPAVVNEAKRRGVEPTRTLLDRSVHQSAMTKLADAPKRGRPDLAHITLISVTSSPLYKGGLVKLYLHCHGDLTLELEDKTRPPKSYFRFRALIEKTLYEMPSVGLIRAYRTDLKGLLRKKIRPDLIVGLSIQGEYRSLDELSAGLIEKRNPTILIGGFATGHFHPSTLEILDKLVRVHYQSLDAHVVASRLVYEVEKRLERANQ